MSERLDIERMNQNDIDLMRQRISFDTDEVNKLADHLEDFAELQKKHRINTVKITEREKQAIATLDALTEGDNIYRLTKRQAAHIRKAVNELSAFIKVD